MATSRFAQMQMATIELNTIEKCREDLKKAIEFFKSLGGTVLAEDFKTLLPSTQEEQADIFCDERNFNFDEVYPIIQLLNGFMIDEDIEPFEVPDEHKVFSLGLFNNGYCTYAGRFVFPVYDVRGNPMGFVGWEKGVKPKYLDSETYGYKAKETTLFGMQFLPKYYDEYVIITEGIMCMIWLLSKGFNSMASLGSHLSPYVIEILSRFGDKCIIIADADEAGNKFINQVKFSLPKARCYQSTVAKDVDDSRQVKDDLAEDIEKIIKGRFYKPKYFRIGKYIKEMKEID